MIESGIGISNPLFFIGVVENNDDPHFEGRVKVRAFSIHGDNSEVPTTDLPWAICVKGDYEASGAVPPLNSFVYGMFLDGRAAQHPLVLGLIPSVFAEPINPEKNGWGVIPDCDGDVKALGSRPQDFGQPQQSRLARGESLEETYIPQQEMNRVENVYIAGQSEDEPQEDERTVWSEPNSAYGAKYPFNRVIQTAKHSIEIDDTPGAERIMIYHNEGSYVQIDSRGSTTHKSVGDKYEINDKQQHVYVGGPSMVTINNDSYVYVKGNKVEEIEGDYRMIVHGNASFGIGQQMFVNAGNQIQMRGADVMVEANKGALELFAAEEMKQTSGIDFHMTAKKMFQKYGEEMHVKSGDVIKFESENGLWAETKGDDGINFKSSENFKLQTGETISMKAGDAVNVDPGSGIIDLASGSSVEAPSAEPTDAEDAAKPEMPAPPEVSTSIVNSEIRSMNAPVKLASDDATDPSHEEEASNTFGTLGEALGKRSDLTVGDTYNIGGVNYILVEGSKGTRSFKEVK